MKQTHRNLLTGLVFLIVFTGLGFLWTTINDRNTQPDNTSVTEMQVQEDCALEYSVCQANAGSLRIDIQLDQKPVYLRPFTVIARIQGIPSATIRHLQLEFMMSDMEMGLNRYRLSKSASGDWHTRVILPVCTTGRYDWIMRLYVRTTKKQYRVLMPVTVSTSVPE